MSVALVSNMLAGSGELGQRLLNHNMHVGALRPVYDPATGRSFITVNDRNGAEVVLTTNATGYFRKDDWVAMDKAVQKAAKSRLRLVADVRGAGLEVPIPDGLASNVFDWEQQSDVSEATVDMSPITRSRNDRPQYNLKQLPLPVIFKDFSLDIRQILASRKSGTPIDTSTADLYARRVAEEAEKLLAGTDTFTFAGNTIYGYTNHPDAALQDMSDPTSSTWSPEDTVNDAIAMIVKSEAKLHYGPWQLYLSQDWRTYIERDYKNASSGLSTTLRQRLKAIDGITDVKLSDFLPTQTAVLVQMTSDTVREIVNLDITVVQWESQGGFEQNFKVIAGMTPNVRSDINGNMGLVVGSY